MTPEKDDALMWLATLATATAGEMPMKINSGVIRKPPPMPNMPEMNPTAIPIKNRRKRMAGMAAIGWEISTGVVRMTGASRRLDAASRHVQGATALGLTH